MTRLVHKVRLIVRTVVATYSVVVVVVFLRDTVTTPTKKPLTLFAERRIGTVLTNFSLL